MFKHEKSIGKNEEIEQPINSVNNIWEVNDEECEETECIVNVSDVDATFSKPSHSEESDCRTTDVGSSLKCAICDYEATSKHDLKYHEDMTHNWCWVCDKGFETKRDFKIHHYTVHSSSKSIWD